jgi:hypothetical protein
MPSAFRLPRFHEMLPIDDDLNRRFQRVLVVLNDKTASIPAHAIVILTIAQTRKDQSRRKHVL